MSGVAELAPLKIEAPPEFRQKIKVRAAELGLTMREYIMEAVEQRLAAEDAPRGLPAGDAACAWHALDLTLQKLREARDGLDEAGCERLAERLQGVVQEVEVARREAESVVAKTL